MAPDRPSPPSPVVLHANLLYPFQLRNLLVQFGADSVIAPRWTTRIHEEWIGNLVADERAPHRRLLLTLDLMNGALPDADVRDWEKYMQGLTLSDPDDCHVLAAALAAKARTILTMNLRDFPASELSPHGVVAVHPDGFLCELYDADPELVRASTEAALCDRGKAPAKRWGISMQLFRRYAMLAAILLPMATAAHANLLVNGDFAQGPIVRHGWKPVTKGRKSIVAWHVRQNSVDYVTTYWQQPTAAVASIDMNGTATKRNESPNQPGMLVQSFATGVGSSYQLTFYLSANPAGGPAERTMLVKVGNTTARFHWNVEKERNTLSDMKWKLKTVAFTATAASTELKLISTTKTGVFGPAIALVSVDPTAPTRVPSITTALH